MDDLDKMLLQTYMDRLDKLEKLMVDNDRPDSIEYGTPKGGKYKVYGNARNPDEFRTLIDNMNDLLNHAAGGQ